MALHPGSHGSHEDNVFDAVSKRVGRDETPGGNPRPDGSPSPQVKQHTEVEDSLAGGLELATSHLENLIQSGEPPSPEAIQQFEKFGALIVQIGGPAGSGVPVGPEQAGAPPLPQGPGGPPLPPPGPVQPGVI